jgi:hypothetical protein
MVKYMLHYAANGGTVKENGETLYFKPNQLEHLCAALNTKIPVC